MKKMREWAKRIASAGLSLALLLGSGNLGLAAANVKDLNTVHAASAVSRQSIHDGTILHAFAWNFNTIKENIPDIAAAGYTAVQTSPINECLSTEPGLTLFSDTGKWYYHYQPTDWVIGNYQLGTRDEFKAMCDEADKYGIGIIVDIDPNHTTPVFDQLGDGLLNAVGGKDNLYHINGADTSRNMNYSDRVSTTYDPMGGLPDVDTESDAFQQYFYEFLQDCIACGADGFRIDTAKHIALPDDGVPAEYAGQEDRNDFYPNMKSYIDEYASKDYADLFVYGEVLQGDTARLAAYQDMLGGTTASDYGGTIRTAISSGSLAASKLESYKISDDVTNGVTYPADSDKLVTWVESHDNYINDKSYNVVDDTDVILAWSIITAREDGTPLFFSRPMGSSKDNVWGDNILGTAGSDIYKDPQVVAVNKFRTAMVGEPETLRNANGNNSLLMIERGNKGVVIVNASESDMDIDTETGILDGTYIDSVEGSDALFNVKDGVITGTIKAKSAVVLDKIADGDYSTLFFFNSRQWSDVKAVVDNNTYNGRNTGDGWWSVTIPSKEFEVEFTDGTDKSDKFAITSTSGRYMTGVDGRIFATKQEAEDAVGIITKSVYFFNTVGWSTVYAYAWTDSTQYFGGWPGMSAKNEGGYWWRADVKMMNDTPFNIIFNNNNGSQTVDVNMSDASKNYVVLSNNQPGGNLAVEQYSSKQEAMDAIGIYSDKTTVYFYNTRGWQQVGVYTWGDVQVGEWPGTLAEYEGDNWWKVTLNAAPSADLNIIFNDYGVGSQTGNLVVDSVANRYFWGDNKYASKAAAEQAAYDFEHAEGEDLEQKDGHALVYYYNESYWNDVYVYAWGGNYNNCIGDWPGTKMSKVDGNWYAANVPTEALNNTELHLIFNNGNGTQNPDNVVTDTSKLYFTTSSLDGFASKQDVEDYLGVVKPTEPEEPTEPTEPEVKPVDEEPAVADGYTRLYSKVDTSWTEEVYMYAWLKKDDGTSAGEPFETWPGKKMMHIGNGWHAVDIENKYLAGYVDEEVEVEDPITEDVKTEPVEDKEELTEESVDTRVEETVEEITEESDVISVLTNVIDVLTSAFKPMTASAKETVKIPVEIQYIVHGNDAHKNESAVVTTVRPSDEELGKTAEPSEPSEPAQPEKPSQPVKPSPTPSVTPSQPQAGGQQSAGQGSQPVVAPKTEVALNEAQVPLAGAVKSADANTKKSTKATKKAVAEDKEEATEETTETAEDQEVAAEEETTTEEQTTEEATEEEETPVEIADEEAPKEVENSKFPVVPVAAGVVVVAAAAGAGLFIKRKHF
ncbi:starch-binding protein [Pseudobutyrivibrio sp.]